jgi:hypothetical protein
MGSDYISKSKKSHRKGWDLSRRKFSMDEMFAEKPESIRTILITPFDPSDLTKFSDGPCELNIEDGRIFAYSKQRQSIGVCKEPPRSIQNAVAALGGKTLGMYRQRQKYSGNIEVSIYLGPQTDR